MQAPRTTHLIAIAAALAVLAVGTWLYTNAHEAVEGLPDAVTDARPPDARVPETGSGTATGGADGTGSGTGTDVGGTPPDGTPVKGDGTVQEPSGPSSLGGDRDRAACEKAGGTWNECASACPPDAEACTMVCVQKCEGLPTVPPITLHFPNSKLDPDQLDCAKVFPVRRAVASAVDSRAALEALLKGPTKEEQASGSVTSIPAGTALRSLSVRGGVAYADFNAGLRKAAGSCLVTSVRAQIEATLKSSSSSIRSVVISIEGGDPDEALQP